MKTVYIAKTLVEDIDFNSCSVEVFETKQGANDWASDEIDICADGYENPEIVKETDFYRIMSGDVYITIEVEEKNILL